MLPIKRKHYNLLTGQFEDENHFSLLPTTSYSDFVSETNENDVEITRIKSNLAKYVTDKQGGKEIQLAKINRKYDLKIAEEYSSVEKIKTLAEILMTRTDKSEAESIEPDSEGFFSWIFPQTKRTIVRLK